MIFRVGHSTISKVVHSTCIAIKNILTPTCLPALTKERLSAAAHGFERRTHYPHIVGAIDGKLNDTPLSYYLNIKIILVFF